MAYPPLHRKLFKSDGAGPELKEEIVPHELTNGLTAPSYSVNGGGGLLRNVVNHTNPTGELIVRNEVRMDTSAGDEGAYIVLREQTGNGDDAPAGSIYMHAYGGSETCEVHITPKSVGVSEPIYCDGRVTADGFTTNAPIFFGTKGAFCSVAEDGAFVVGNQVTATYPNIWFQSENDGARLYYNQSAYRLQSDHWMAAVGFTATSDARHKRDLTPVRYDLSSLSAYHYVLKDDGKPHVGLVAQEVQEVIPDAVSSDKDGTLSLDYNAITAALVEEVKDLKRRCDSLESEKVSLRAAVENLAEQKKSLEKICALLTRGQDALRDENESAMEEIQPLKKRVEKLEAKA